ncbi:hypothetical protein L2E82_49844 [Cichorium intybus]|uniref:Uncharacterized protein n=1 Tax=Cichorium intybus TaxID=13427 RepID=A0ACB8Z1H3_CICIN|nr:hypothetical protein L2E82_49844 [Cichorium intybus]
MRASPAQLQILHRDLRPPRIRAAVGGGNGLPAAGCAVSVQININSPIYGDTNSRRSRGRLIAPAPSTTVPSAVTASACFFVVSRPCPFWRTANPVNVSWAIDESTLKVPVIYEKGNRTSASQSSSTSTPPHLALIGN